MYNIIIKRRKSIVLIISCLLLVFFVCIMGDIKGEKGRFQRKIEDLGTNKFRVCVCNILEHEMQEQDICIEWWKNDLNDTYYLFLPAHVDDEWKFVFNLYDTIWIDNDEIHTGSKFHLDEGSHTVRTENDEEIALEVRYSKNIASMFIDPTTGSLDEICQSKENVATGRYIIFDELGEVECRGTLDEIKTRGNGTFYAPKKSFSIKMNEEEEILGIDKGKKWVLLANASDDTLSRNHVVTQIAQEMNMDYVPEMVYTDLYIDGEYLGNYQIYEKVEIAEGRVAIRDLEEEMEDINPNIDFALNERMEKTGEFFTSIKYIDIQNEPVNTESGYLLELDIKERYDQELSGFISSRNQPVVIKSPQYVGYNQVNYIANRYQDLEDALCSANGYNENTGLYYYDYLDVESFAQKYLIEEISKNLDASLTSFYMYIPESDCKFHAGPIWDYDSTFGDEAVREGIALKDSRGFFAAENIHQDEREFSFLYLLCQHDGFREKYKEIYFENFRDIMISIVDESIDSNAHKIADSAMMDAIRWKHFDGETDIEKNLASFYQKMMIL